jgi:hypothetical protein
MSRHLPLESPSAGAERLSRIEERLARVEAQLGLAVFAAPPSPPRDPGPTSGEEFELEMGQDWFAAAGIVALTLGVAFLLSLPYPSLPAAAPSLAGAALAALLLAAARARGHVFQIVAGHLRVAGMALLFFAALRLFFFGTRPALAVDSPAGLAILAGVVALNMMLAWRRHSPWLFGFALAMGYAGALLVGGAGFVLSMIAALALAGGVAQVRAGWPALSFVTIGLGHASYFLWATGNPMRGGAYHFVSGPVVAPWLPLATTLLLGAATAARHPRNGEDGLRNVQTFFNCALGYGVFLLHTAAAFPASFVFAHVSASLAFLGLALACSRRERGEIPTFFHAMTGYVALSVAIIKATPVPEVFVWLSLQSLLVVTTAVLFRSRFIVVANFCIYVAIVLAYVLVAQRERGISVGFGLVALGSARILHWQKCRLELKTELARNAYLVGALLVFPYTLYHLVPRTFVGLAWVGLAAVYYGLNLIVRSVKYRWMGHATLLGTMLYVLAIGTRQFEPAYRVLSFLAVGALLLIVSLSFARNRRMTD